MKLFKLEAWVELEDDAPVSTVWDALDISNNDFEGTLHWGLPGEASPVVDEPHLPVLTLIAEVSK
jgi:hypothetical protein